MLPKYKQLCEHVVVFVWRVGHHSLEVVNKALEQVSPISEPVGVVPGDLHKIVGQVLG